MTDRAVAKLQALVRIPDVSHPDPARSTPAPSTRSSTRCARPVPAAARAARAAPASTTTACCSTGPARRRPAGRADGAPRRRARRRGGALAAPALRRRDRRRRRLGPRHARRQGLAGRDLRGRRAAPRARTSRPPQDVWLSFGARRGGLRAGRTGRRRGARSPRRDARGSSSTRAARSRTRPSRASSRRSAVIGVTEKGTTTLELRAEGRGGHASTPAPDGPDRPARAGRSCGWRSARSRPRCPSPTLEMMHRIAPHAPARAAAAVRQRPPAPAAAHPRPARRRRRARRDDAHHRRRHHALRLPRAQRDRLDRPRRRQPPDHGRRHRRLGDSSTSARRSPTTRIRLDVVEANEPSPVSPTDDDAFRLLESTISEVVPGRGARRRT